MLKKSERIGASLENLNKAFGQFSSFLKDPVLSERDKAGVIQAFEFTVELFWKTFQRIAEENGLSPGGPKQSLMAAFQLKLIPSQEEQLWLTMLKDRNLTSHIYHQELSDEILGRVQKDYFPAFQRALKRISQLDASADRGSVPKA